MIDDAGLISGPESIVDVDNGDPGGTAVEHAEKRGNAAETGALPDAGGNSDDRTGDQATDHAGQGAFHSYHNHGHLGLGQILPDSQ